MPNSPPAEEGPRNEIPYGPKSDTSGQPASSRPERKRSSRAILKEKRLKESKTSILHLERTEPSSQALLRPTPPIEQENNILVMQDIGKQYQLAVKEYNINVRDNRIKAKDQQIAEMDETIGMQEKLLWITRMEEKELGNLARLRGYVIDHQKDKIEELTRKNTVNERAIKGLARYSDEQDTSLRLLRNELESAKAENRDLKNPRLLYQILALTRTILGHSPIASMRGQTPAFPLMRLPGELRNLVYKHCLVLGHPIDLWPMVPSGEGHGAIYRSYVVERDLANINPALLRTSRQVYKEAIGILYGCNRFRFSDRGGWTILEGFLFHISRNCQYLTNISVNYPDWCSQDIAILPRTDLDARTIQCMQTILQRFGNTVLDAPTGPALDSVCAYKRAGATLLKLPALRSLSIIVPHSVQLHEFGIDIIAKILSDDDDFLKYYILGSPASKPKRTFVLLRREPTQPQFYGIWGTVDDDGVLGRAALAHNCEKFGAVIKGGSYGKRSDCVSYFVDGGEDEYDVDIPKYVEPAGLGDFVLLRTLGALKRYLGY